MWKPYRMTLPGMCAALVWIIGVANASAQTLNLTIHMAGPNTGAVGLIPIGACNAGSGSSCTFQVTSGTELRASANAPGGSAPGVFSDGTGSATGCATSTCRFTMTEASELTATFDASAPRFMLSVQLAGDGTGQVSEDNNTCQNFDPVQGSACTTGYAPDSVVTLEARAAAASRFAVFSDGTGDAVNCSATPCSFTLSGPSEVTATFRALSTITVTPPIATISVGQDQGFVANGTYTDDVTEAISTGELGTWTTKVLMPTPRFSLAAAPVGGQFYAVGGIGLAPCGDQLCERPTEFVEVYDAASNSWSSRASMRTAREALGIGVIADRFVYAVGGNQPGSTPVDVLERYDTSSDTWMTLTPMPGGPRRSLAAGVVNGKLYAVGGEDTTGVLNRVEEYDPGTNTWTAKMPMPTARKNLAVAVVNGVLYAIGGGNISGPLATVEAYDPSTDRWSARAAMPDPRSLHGAAVADDVLYVMGGQYGTQLRSTLVYDAKLDRWNMKSLMPTARTELGAVALGGRVYAVGGHDIVNNLRLGTTEAFTDTLRWNSSNAAVASISQYGQATGLSGGTTSISASVGPISCAQGSSCATLTVTGAVPAGVASPAGMEPPNR